MCALLWQFDDRAPLETETGQAPHGLVVARIGFGDDAANRRILEDSLGERLKHALVEARPVDGGRRHHEMCTEVALEDVVAVADRVGPGPPTVTTTRWDTRPLPRDVGTFRGVDGPPTPGLCPHLEVGIRRTISSTWRWYEALPRHSHGP